MLNYSAFYICNFYFEIKNLNYEQNAYQNQNQPRETKKLDFLKRDPVFQLLATVCYARATMQKRTLVGGAKHPTLNNDNPASRIDHHGVALG